MKNEGHFWQIPQPTSKIVLWADCENYSMRCNKSLTMPFQKFYKIIDQIEITFS